MLNFNGNEPKEIRYDDGIKLPEVYTRLEYIESNGTQYIDTGVKCLQSISCLIKNNFNQLSGTQLFGAYKSPRRTHYGIVDNQMHMPTVSNGGTTEHTFLTDANSHTYFLSSNLYKYDNTNIDNGNFEFVNDLNFYLFARNNNGSVTNYCESKLSFAKFWIDNILVRNFIPARRNSDNEVGLYDIVNNVFYTNQGTGSFVAGQEYKGHNVSKVVYNNKVVWKGLPSTYTRLEYIESTGTQYIDTGVKSGSNVKIKSKFASTNIEVTRNYVFGAYNQNKERMQFSYVADMFLGYGDKYISKQFNIDMNKHIIQLYNGVFTLDGQIIETISANNFKSSSRNVFLFAVNGTSTMSYSYIKMYATQMWENDTLVRNFIPARRNSDNEVGLYDTVNDVFYTNEGTGTFIAGEYN